MYSKLEIFKMNMSIVKKTVKMNRSHDKREIRKLKREIQKIEKKISVFCEKNNIDNNVYKIVDFLEKKNKIDL